MKLLEIIKRIKKLFLISSSSLYASSICYYFCVSFIPSTLLLLSLLSLFASGSHFPISIPQIIPLPVLKTLKKLFYQVNSHQDKGIISLSGFITLWSSSKGMLGLKNGLNHMMMVYSDNSFLKQRIRTILILISLLLLWITFMVLPFCIINLSTSNPYLSFTLHILGKVLRIPLVYSSIILFALFTVLYRILPSASFPYRFCMIGAAFASVGWQILLVLYSLYILYFSSYPSLYGSLGVIILGVIWLNLGFRVILLGGRIVFISKICRYFQIV